MTRMKTRDDDVSSDKQISWSSYPWISHLRKKLIVVCDSDLCIDWLGQWPRQKSSWNPQH